ncbi:hypothetical protein WA026_012487 [Henosepilachna vigintioctopunctata]|uniref:Amino acid transporter transmembrane domain-containing protein n=1 Tax=Henosepilachna vigintioctopunctata TaxID=420089 RepID=A0AAW1V1I8_9CUCU
MPLAFAHAGLAMGFVNTIIVGIICTHSIEILVKSAHMIYQRNRIPAIGFADLAEASFQMGPKLFHRYAQTAKFLINFFLVTDLIGCCAVYVVLVAKNLKQVVDIRTETDYDTRIYMVVLLIPLILINLIKNLKYLSPCSMIANVLMVTGLGITFYFLCQDIPPLDERPQFIEVQQWPLFFGTVIFAMEGIGVVMPLENNMLNPSHFIGCPGILNIGMTILITLYSVTGFLGYLKYGNKTESVITLNLDKHDPLAQSVKLMIAIGIFFTYTIQFYVPMGVIWHYVKTKFSKNLNIAEYALRISLVTFTVLLAIVVPNLGGFISLIGAVTISMLGLVFPALIETATIYENPGFGKFNWRLIKNIFIIFFGFLGFFSGTYVSLKEIFESY